MISAMRDVNSLELMEFFFSSRRRHTRWTGDWSSDVCSSDLSNGWRRLSSRVPLPSLRREEAERLSPHPRRFWMRMANGYRTPRVFATPRRCRSCLRPFPPAAPDRPWVPLQSVRPATSLRQSLADFLVQHFLRVPLRNTVTLIGL